MAGIIEDKKKKSEKFNFVQIAKLAALFHDIGHMYFDRIENSKLGYNDAQQLVILKSNVPTYTITPIWLSGGKYRESEWQPLFDRTDKP